MLERSFETPEKTPLLKSKAALLYAWGFFAHAGVLGMLWFISFTTVAFVVYSPELQCLDINRGVSGKISFTEMKSLVL